MYDNNEQKDQNKEREKKEYQRVRTHVCVFRASPSGIAVRDVYFMRNILNQNYSFEFKVMLIIIPPRLCIVSVGRSVGRCAAADSVAAVAAAVVALYAAQTQSVTMKRQTLSIAYVCVLFFVDLMEEKL